MYLRVWLFALCTAHAAVLDTLRPGTPLTEKEILETLRDSPSLLPLSSRQVLAARIKAQQEHAITKRQSSNFAATIGSLATSFENLSRKPPQAKVADVQVEQSPRWPGAVRKKIRYGPYRIPPVSEKSIEAQILKAGGLTNTISIGTKKPCTGECTLLRLYSSMEMADGGPVDSKAWLHHVVILNYASGLKDPTCGGPFEHIFESGNERTDVEWALPDTSMKSGYHLKRDHILMMNTELMNMEDKEKWVWLTLTFDYLEGPRPDYEDGRVVWNSVGPDRCTNSEENPFGKTNLTKSQQPTKTVFMEHSNPWVAPKDGLLLGANGHLHDGGVDIEVFINDKQVCISKAHYSSGGRGMGGMSGGHKKRKRQAALMAAHNATNEQIKHIYGQNGCTYAKPVQVKKGDRMWIRSNYDFEKYPGMTNKKGELDEVMGIIGALFAF